VVNPAQTHTEWLFQQPPALDLSDPNQLPAYTALVSLTAAPVMHPLDGERL